MIAKLSIRKLESSSELIISIIISTDEDPSLRIESFAIIKLRGVSTKLFLNLIFTMQTYKEFKPVFCFKMCYQCCVGRVCTLVRHFLYLNAIVGRCHYSEDWYLFLMMQFRLRKRFRLRFHPLSYNVIAAMFQVHNKRILSIHVLALFSWELLILIVESEKLTSTDSKPIMRYFMGSGN